MRETDIILSSDVLLHSPVYKIEKVRTGWHELTEVGIHKFASLIEIDMERHQGSRTGSGTGRDGSHDFCPFEKQSKTVIPSLCPVACPSCSHPI